MKLLFIRATICILYNKCSLIYDYLQLEGVFNFLALFFFKVFKNSLETPLSKYYKQFYYFVIEKIRSEMSVSLLWQFRMSAVLKCIIYNFGTSKKKLETKKNALLLLASKILNIYAHNYYWLIISARKRRKQQRGLCVEHQLQILVGLCPSA